MPYADLVTHRIRYAVRGAEDAPPLLLVMGLGLCSMAWHTLPDRLAQSFRVIAFDHRGLGGSTAPPGGFRTRDLADDAAGVLDAEGIRDAFVFGISMGGMVAQELALRHPRRVRALALGCTFGGHLRSRKPPLAIARDLLLVSLLARQPRRLARLLVSDEYFAKSPERFRAWMEQLSDPPRATARRQIIAIAAHEAERRLPALRVPTLVITGRPRPAGAARELAAAGAPHPRGEAPRAHRRRPRLPGGAGRGDGERAARALPGAGRGAGRRRLLRERARRPLARARCSLRAVIYESFGGPLSLRELPDPSPEPDGAVIRVRASGVCRSDWHGWKGHDPDIRLPHVPGHELAGEVEAVGAEVRGFAPGDRVTLPFVCGCGTCPTCAAGNPQVCERQFQPGFTAWGSFAERVAIRYAERNLVRLPAEVDFADAAALGCRYATSFRAVVQQGALRAGEWLAVFGCGGVGLSAVQIGAAVGGRVVAIDVREGKLELARAQGAAAVVNAALEPDAAAAVEALTGGGAHVSIDALGSEATLSASVRSLRRRGRHVQVGLLLGGESAPRVPMDRVVARELALLGSHGMAAHAYPAMLGLVAAGALRPGLLVRRRLTLGESMEALTTLDSSTDPGIAVVDRF